MLETEFFLLLLLELEEQILFHSNSNHIYRRTGISQMEDILNCEYVRSKLKVNGGHKKEVFWSLGGDDLFYFDGSPILEVPNDKLIDG